LFLVFCWYVYRNQFTYKLRLVFDHSGFSPQWVTTLFSVFFDNYSNKTKSTQFANINNTRELWHETQTDLCMLEIICFVSAAVRVLLTCDWLLFSSDTKLNSLAAVQSVINPTSLRVRTDMCDFPLSSAKCHKKSTSSSNGVQQGATSKEHNPRKSSKRKNRWLWRRSGTEKQEKDVATNDDTKTSSILQTSFNGFNFYQSETKSNYYYMINCSNSHSSRVANQSPRSTLLKLIHQSESSLFT